VVQEFEKGIHPHSAATMLISHANLIEEADEAGDPHYYQNQAHLTQLVHTRPHEVSVHHIPVQLLMRVSLNQSVYNLVVLRFCDSLNFESENHEESSDEQLHCAPKDKQQAVALVEAAGKKYQFHKLISQVDHAGCDSDVFDSGRPVAVGLRAQERNALHGEVPKDKRVHHALAEIEHVERVHKHPAQEVWLQEVPHKHD
jgi:hypothetical protein